MENLLRLAEKFDRPPRFFGKVAGWVMLPLIAIIMFDVITRKIDAVRIGMAELQLRWLNPIIFQDLEWHLHGIILFLSFGFGYLMNSHVRVDIFREQLTRRKQAWIELWGLVLLGIPYLILISYFAYRFVALSFGQGEGSESLTGIGMRYIIKSFMLFGFLLLLSAFIATLLRIIAYLFGGESNEQAALDTLSVFPQTADELAAAKAELERAAAEAKAKAKREKT